MIKNAAFYLADTSIFGSKLFDRDPKIKAYKALPPEDQQLRLLMHLDWGEIIFNMMPAEQMQAHMEGLSGYLQKQTQGFNQSDIIYIRSRVYHVRASLGCNITHAEGKEQEVIQFLLNLNFCMNGLLFFFDTFWDWTGDPLCGLKYRLNSQSQ